MHENRLWKPALKAFCVCVTWKNELLLETKNALAILTRATSKFFTCCYRNTLIIVSINKSHQAEIEVSCRWSCVPAKYLIHVLQLCIEKYRRIYIVAGRAIQIHAQFSIHTHIYWQHTNTYTLRLRASHLLVLVLFGGVLVCTSDPHSIGAITTVIYGK